MLVGLPPGTYQVDAGPGTERTVTLIVSSTSTLNFEGGEQVTALGEVQVSGNRLAEVRTSEVGGNVSLRQIESTPQITRNFLEFADAVPGMKFEVDAKGNTQIRSGTLNTGATNVYIDGVGQKNYVRPSGITRAGRRRSLRNLRREPGHRRRSGQPVPAARHRRIQGHHVELQGRVRPGFRRRDHGRDALRHQRIRSQRLHDLHGCGPS